MKLTITSVSTRIPRDLYEMIWAARRPGQSFGGALREMLAANLAADARAKAAPQVQYTLKGRAFVDQVT